MSVWQLGAWDFKGNERFEVRRRIGEGGMGVVYEAYDRERQTEVALKILIRMSPGAIYRIKKEFRALADVNHPNLVTLHELVSSGEHWFFTMELVEGVNFLQYVRPGLVSEALTEDETLITLVDGIQITRTMPDPTFVATGGDDLLNRVAVGETDPSELPPIDYDRLRHALKELAEGLVALHDAHKLHRDIKPSNVMITSRGRLVLLDFGLATDVDEDSLAHSAMGSVVGTVAYMAPEQASGENVSPASDWYAVGTMLYQALTGTLPYSGTLYQVIFDKQQHDPKPINDLVQAPRDLTELCKALLTRDPSRRPSGRQILEKLGGLPPALATPALSFSVPDLSPQFVGRDEHLAALEDAFATSADDASVIVHVRGTSGIGKTALVRHFLEQLEVSSRAVVFTGRCYERELVPYKALDNLIDGMSRYLRKSSYQEVSELLPEGIESLARLFPVLNRVDAIHHRSARAEETPDPIQVRSRAFSAFRELLRRIGEMTPVVLCLDDLQWGDADSASLIEELLRQPNAPPLMLIAVYRSEDRDASELLRVLRMPAEHPRTEVRDLLVGPLGYEAARALARSIMERIEAVAPARTPSRGTPVAGGEDLLERTEEIVRESQGSPLFIYELAVHSQHSEQTEANPAVPLEDAITSQSISLREVLRYRLNHVPIAARDLLEVVAVAGRPLRLEVANMAAGLEPKERSAAALLTSNHLARTRSTGGNDEIEAYHDRIRTAVVEGMDASTLRRRRRALAAALEADDRVSPEELVLALQEAGQNERASEAASRAAARSLDATAFYQAASLYGLALDLSSDGDDRWDLRAKWADALAQAGRGDESAATYLRAAEKAPKDKRVDLMRRAAEQYLRFGMTTRGIKVLEEVLGHFGMEYPETAEDAFQSLRLIRSRLLLRGLSFRERDASEIPIGTLARVDVCWSAGVGLTMVDPHRASIFISSFLHLALDAGDPHRVARALAMELGLLSSQGEKSPNRVTRVLATLEDLAERVEDPYVQGFAALGECFASWHAGRWADCAARAADAEAILRDRCTGVDWELQTASSFRLWSESYRGNFLHMRDELDAHLQDAKTRQNVFGATVLRMSANASIIWLADDDLPAARRHLEEARQDSAQAGFHLQHFWELSTRVLFDLYAKDGLRAFKRITQHWPQLEESMFMRVQVIRGEARYLRARAALAAARHEEDPAPYLSAAREDADALEKEGTPYAIPLGQLVRARAVQQMGLKSEASALYERAARGFKKADMALHALAAHRRRAKLIPSDGRAITQEVDRRMRERGIGNPEAMTDLLVP